MISTITQTISTLTVFPDRSNYTTASLYAADVAAWLAEEQTFNGELITVRTQMNTMASDMDGVAATVDADATAAAASAVTASNSANYAGLWDSGTDFLLQSVSHGGVSYASLQSPNQNKEPGVETAYWTPLTPPVSIDRTVEYAEASNFTYANDLLTQVDYTEGYKVEFTYVKPSVITNGLFPTDMTGWTLTLAGGTISVATAQALFTQSGTPGAMKAAQSFTTISGLSYVVTLDVLTESSAGSDLAVKIGTTSGGSEISTSGGITVQAFTTTFVATGVTTYITLEDNQAASATSTWDNVVIKEVLPSALSLSQSQYYDTNGSTLILTKDLHYIGDKLESIIRTEA